MSDPVRSDVLVVGGGLMGLTTAFFLARRGVSVTVVERGLVGRQASGTNFGAVRRQGRPLSQLPLSNRAREIWWSLPELIGEDCEFVKRGHLRIALDDKAAANVVTYAESARDHGLDVEILGREALRRRFPALSERPVAGTFSPLDGHANPRLAGPAFARAAVRAGAHIVEHCEIAAAGKAGEDFVVEAVDGRTFRAPALMLATGAWSARLAGLFGEVAPIEVKGPQLSVSEPLPYFLGPNMSAAASDADDSVYFRQVTRGNLVIGGPRHGPASIETGLADVLPEILMLQLARTRRVLPILGKVRIIRSWSGVEGYTPDGQPLMGASDRVSGLFHAYGFSGAGFQLSPAVGETMASLIATGTSPISLAPYGPGRFPPGTRAEGAALRMLSAKGE